MRLPVVLPRSAGAVMLALSACSPAPSAVMDASSGMPEPVRPAAPASPRDHALTGFALAVSAGGTELYVLDAARAEVTGATGTAGDTDIAPDSAAARVRGALSDLRVWAEDGAVMVDGPPPFAGRARAQTRGGMLRFSLTPRAADGSPGGSITAEVRGGEITGRLAQRSPAGAAQAWSHGAFFRAPLRRVDARDWPPRAPRTLTAERLADGGVLLRWTVARNAPADAEYLVFRAADSPAAAVQAGATRKTQYVTDAGEAGGAWYVVTRSAAGMRSGPSPSATLP